MPAGLTARGLVVVVAGVIAAVALPAAAQPPDEAGRSVTVEEIENGWTVTPDFRLTEIDNELTVAAGVYGGYLLDRRLLLGAGAYWLEGDRTDLSYFGPLIEWSTKTGGRFDVSVRALVGLGSATRYESFEEGFGPGFEDFDAAALSFPPRFRRGGRGFGHRFGPGFGSYYDEFALAEPHVSLLTRVTDWLGVSVGVGYRATNTDFDTGGQPQRRERQPRCQTRALIGSGDGGNLPAVPIYPPTGRDRPAARCTGVVQLFQLARGGPPAWPRVLPANAESSATNQGVARAVCAR
jgi:hypothetical protein